MVRVVGLRGAIGSGGTCCTDCYVSPTNVSCLLFPQFPLFVDTCGPQWIQDRRSSLTGPHTSSAESIDSPIVGILFRPISRIAQTGERVNMPTRINRCLRLVFCIGTLICLILTPAFPQSDLGTISGFVKDPSGASVPNAKITVQNKSGLQRQAIT